MTASPIDALTKYHLLGQSGLRVSPLALGTMTFGTDWGWGSSEETAHGLLARYLEAGGNFIDTADGYTSGSSERIIGSFFARHGGRDRAVIATKFSVNTSPGDPNAGGNGRKNILRAVEGSLRRLGTDHIDLYILHTWDRFTPVEEVMRTMDDLLRSGKVLHVGLSDVPAWYASRAQAVAEWRGWEPVSALQLEYSLAERSIEHEFVDLGRETGAGIMVWSPLASGLLSGKYKAQDSGAGRLDQMRNSRNPAFAKFTDRNWAIVAELEAVANELGRSMAQVAVNWAANRPGVASVLIGATKLPQIHDSLRALDCAIPPELLARLDAVSRPETPFPYSFFQPAIQAGLTGGASVGDKWAGYAPARMTKGSFAGVE